jgi:hypothetical protein
MHLRLYVGLNDQAWLGRPHMYVFRGWQPLPRPQNECMDDGVARTVRATCRVIGPWWVWQRGNIMCRVPYAHGVLGRTAYNCIGTVVAVAVAVAV